MRYEIHCYIKPSWRNWWRGRHTVFSKDNVHDFAEVHTVAEMARVAFDEVIVIESYHECVEGATDGSV